MKLHLDPHPLLQIAAFETRFPAPLGDITAPQLAPLLHPAATTPIRRDESVRTAVRDMLRYGGYKPTGRGKPASEYLVRAAEEGTLSPINAAVDACNVVSLHSGLPISVIDASLAMPPYRVAVAEAGESYVFNASGQEIDVSGLLCLFDANGPCANAVKDAQRTKTHAATEATISVVWGVAGFESQLQAVVEWYHDLLRQLRAETTMLELAE